jgi:hypothetical protein
MFHLHPAQGFVVDKLTQVATRVLRQASRHSLGCVFKVQKKIRPGNLNVGKID